MKIKKVAAVICTVLIVLSLSACKSDRGSSLAQESSTNQNDIINESVWESVPYNETQALDSTSEYFAQETSEVMQTEGTTAPAETEITTTEVFDDPAQWSKERIVEEYKKAARKSNPTAKTNQRILIKEISVNDGEHENVMSFIKSIIGKFLELNSTPKDGITGGYENLVPEDVSSAKAYKNGNDTVIEMVIVEQTSGIKEDALSGSVGHAITAVGDIGQVVESLDSMGLSLELSEEDTRIYYTNPVVKVTVNENGEIISGAWSYTVEISMNNFKAFGKNVEKAKIVMENTLTV